MVHCCGDVQVRGGVTWSRIRAKEVRLVRIALLSVRWNRDGVLTWWVLPCDVNMRLSWLLTL